MFKGLKSDKRFYLTLGLGFILDRLLKQLSIYYLPKSGLYLIPHFTGLALERNQGIAYSIALPKIQLMVTVTIIIIVLAVLARRSYRRSDWPVYFSYLLILVGAISNFLDRIFWGYVVDMLVITSWPVFNLADLMILSGSVWLAVIFWWQKRA